MENITEKVIGKMKFQNLETGFWTLIDQNEKVYRIVNQIDEILIEDLLIEIEYIISNKTISVYMFGIPIEIINYRIIT